MLSSGIPGIDEYQKLEKEPDFQRLLDASRAFRTEFETREVFSKLYSMKWVEDPFLQWSRRWEYLYVLQRLETWLRNNPDARDIADAGSGFTFFPFHLQQNHSRAVITCLDADPTAGRAIKEAKKVLGHGPEFSLQNLEKLDQDSDSLDAVFSVSVIEHTPNPQKVVEEIHRVLRPNGVFVCTFDVSFETASSMYISRVEELVSRLHALFESQDDQTISVADSAAKTERVTTNWIAEQFPDRLPWRNPRLVWLYDAMRGRFRSNLYRPMTFYCGTFVKR